MAPGIDRHRDAPRFTAKNQVVEPHLEARILGLSIDKAKLEQANLKAKIDQLSASMDQTASSPAEAAATPPRGR